MPGKWNWKKNCPNYYYENLTDFRKTMKTGVGPRLISVATKWL